MSIASNNSKSTNTKKQGFAPAPAQCEQGIRVTSIEYIGEEPVYNMEVETHHNFAVNGGLIVHNCLDALRYGAEEYMAEHRVKIAAI